MCILDELGRGTATFDGTAIAHAVVDHLTRRSRCRTLFATHYHSLVDDWGMDPRVQLGHMDCIVQNSTHSLTSSTCRTDDADGSIEQPREQNEGGEGGGEDEEEEVTFLYRLCNGSSPRSYGINVARLARLPLEVLQLARQQSLRFEEQMKAGAVGASVVADSSQPVVDKSANRTDGRDSELESSTLPMTQSSSRSQRETVMAFFEKLVSVAHSDLPLGELAYVAAELWRRYKLVR